MQVVVAVQFSYYDFNNAVAMVQPNHLYCLSNLSQIAGSRLGIQQLLQFTVCCSAFFISIFSLFVFFVMYNISYEKTPMPELLPKPREIRLGGAGATLATVL